MATNHSSIGVLLERGDESALAEFELDYLDGVIRRYGGNPPTLSQLWELMNEVWVECDCDSGAIDHRFSSFYSHPVWLLNGLFSEIHQESIENRELFSDWVASKSPVRIADFGGGFGSLSRMISEKCQAAVIEVIEPYPHPLALSRCDKLENVGYREKLTGTYDLILSTDVFEHLDDPLLQAYRCAQHLSIGGNYLIANCFYPVIDCHLPQTFHFRYSWDYAMARLGLKQTEAVGYGGSFCRTGDLNLGGARELETRSRHLFALSRYMPNRLARIISRLLLS